MEQRTKPSIKAQIQQAAALLGVDETTFVTSVALERAAFYRSMGFQPLPSRPGRMVLSIDTIKLGRTA